MRYRAIALVAMMVFGGTVQTQAQIPGSPKELGMGGAFVAVSRGYESVFLAPANLALPAAPSWSFGFPQVAFGLTLLGPDFTDLPDFIEFDDVDTARQDELLALIPLNGTHGRFSFRAPVAALSIGGFGAGVQYSAIGGHTLSRDLAELFLRGYEDGRTDYSVGDTHGDLATFWDVVLAYARPVGDVSVGLAGHYYRGGSLTRTRLFEPRIDLEAQEIEVDYIGVRAEGGTGFGVDVSAAYDPSPDFTVSATLSNAFSRMNWSEDLRVRSLTVDRESIDNGSPEDLAGDFETSDRPFDAGSASLQVFETAEGLYDEAYFPAVARVGIAWRPMASTRVGLDVHRRITDGRLADEWEQRFAVGVQQTLPIIKLRAGYAAGDDGGNMIGGGLSLGPLDMGVARYQRSDIDGDRTRGWIATFGLGVHQP